MFTSAQLLHHSQAREKELEKSIGQDPKVK
jgi:hypothetical protein